MDDTDNAAARAAGEEVLGGSHMSRNVTDFDMKSIFEEQKLLIDHFFEHFEPSQAEALAQEITTCDGTVFFCGVGKSGFICSKVSMSLASIGTKSSFLNPLDALHGDIGNCGPRDIIIFFTKSGSTAELLTLIQGARLKKVRVITVTCSKESPLSKLSDWFVYLPLQRELCPFNLAPVTSTVIQLIFGDTLTAAIMRKRGITLESYAANHPAGAIGRKLLLTVRDIMMIGANVPCVTEGATLSEVILEMTRAGVGCVLIVEDGKLLGIFTDGDLRRLVGSRKIDLDEKIEQHIVKQPIFIEDESMRLADAEMFFHAVSRNVACLPVVLKENGTDLVVKGLLTLVDTVKALS